MQKSLYILMVSLLAMNITSCYSDRYTTNEQSKSQAILVDEEIKKYWYSGLAELSTYALTQQQYGEERNGKAVLIYVTEDFDREDLVKSEKKNDNSFPVLKLNSTKDFVTGIYPYHIMQSTFLPMEKNQNVSKIASSIQEWCGQRFMQLENRKNMEIQINSYFQKIGNQNKSINHLPTENGLWNKLRLFPTKIDTTQTQMLPSLAYLQLHQMEVKGYDVKIGQIQNKDTLQTTLSYPELNRILKIRQESKPPYTILNWEESIKQGDSTYVSRAKQLSQMRIDYWNKNQNEFLYLRDSLEL